MHAYAHTHTPHPSHPIQFHRNGHSLSIHSLCAQHPVPHLHLHLHRPSTVCCPLCLAIIYRVRPHGGALMTTPLRVYEPEPTVSVYYQHQPPATPHHTTPVQHHPPVAPSPCTYTLPRPPPLRPRAPAPRRATPTTHTSPPNYIYAHPVSATFSYVLTCPRRRPSARAPTQIHIICHVYHTCVRTYMYIYTRIRSSRPPARRRGLIPRFLPPFPPSPLSCSPSPLSPLSSFTCMRTALIMYLYILGCTTLRRFYVLRAPPPFQGWCRRK
ncbi:hypothetical protein C8Q76DRAFT_129466 [Earliella scabrosa]|nr:hypothetical protein C8Q76DRAFT_129466 [Earliella scabrosa]